MPHRAILTGLANPEGPEDFFSQMAFLDGEFMGHDNFYKWRLRYMKPDGFGWYVPKEHRPTIKTAVREMAFVMTAKQAGTWTPQVLQRRHVELPRDLRRAYDEMERDWMAKGAETKWSVVAQTWLAEVAAGVVPKQMGGGYWPGKADEIARLVSGELAGESIVVWARFVPEIHGLTAALEDRGIRAVSIYGDVSDAQRDARMESFRSGKVPVIICQPKVSAKGLDFSIADTALVTSNYWDWETRFQMLRRLDHPEKTRPTLTIDVVAEDTVDEAVLDELDGKRRRASYFSQRVMVRRRHNDAVTSFTS